MIKHYILTAWRNLNKNRLYATIHLLGLVLALTTCLLLTAYMSDEFSYDRFHPEGNRIFRVNTDLILPNQKVALSLSSGLVGPSLQNDFPAVQHFTRVSQPWRDLSFQQGETAHFEKNILYVDSSFFTLFNFTLLKGDPTTALREPKEIILTERLAAKYFGNQNPINQSITIDNQPYTITGVAANPPGNSHIEFDALISYATWMQQFPYTEENWTWNPATTYILLNDAASATNISAQLNLWLNTKLPENQKSGEKIALSLEPFEHIHFSEPRLGEFKPKSNKKQLGLLALTGIFIMLIATFNYINLATAVYTNRTREIGVRKTFGANRRQITFQFLSESIILCSVAVLLALLLSHSLLPIFSREVNKILEFDFLSPIVIGIALLTTALIIGPLAGFYPSFVVSRLQVARIFQNRVTTGSDKLNFRRLLIGIQFVISIGLILSTLVVWQQHQFLTNKNLGFAQDHKMVVKLGAENNLAASTETIKQKLLQLPEIQGISFSSHVPSENAHGVGTVIVKEDGTELQSEMELNLVDYDFFKLYGLKIIAGRGFDPSFADSASALIVNETAAKLLGFADPQDIIGKNFRQWEGQGKVIGVVQDFNQHSLHTKITPLTFQVNPAHFEKMTIQYQAGNITSLITKLEKTWRNLAGGTMPFDYSFLDEQLILQYDAEQRFSRLFISFTLLAVFIACIGLFGLTAMAITQRTKEIGIRKVLGASVGSVVTLLSKEFLYLIMAAMILAFPLAWWAMNRWLADFAYRIPIQWWMFALAGLGALTITLVTVSFQAVRAAVANPVKSLRSE